MRLGRILVTVTGALVLVLTQTVGPAAGATHPWGKAIEVPGTGALNSGPSPDGVTTSVSCPSSGNCGAAGTYADSSGVQGFVVNQTAGTWGQAIAVPGLGALNSGGLVVMTSVSCAAADNCTAGGSYTDGAQNEQGFVVTQTAGTWSQAIEVPGLAALDSGGSARVYSVSCASAGNCTAVGSYSSSSRAGPFAATETAGAWGGAVALPGAAAKGRIALSVSCTAPGTCTAVGGDPYGPGAAFVAREQGGTWSNAQPIPGLAALNAGNGAAAQSVSCPSAGSCATVGHYTAAGGSQQAFLASEHNGTWGQAEQIPGLSALGNGLGSHAYTISCPSAGNCLAGGSYTYNRSETQGFAVMQSGGVWGNAATIPGLSSLNKAFAGVNSVSCASKGDCAIGGFYSHGKNAATTGLPFVADQTAGVLRPAQEVPGIAALNTGTALSQVLSVSCARGGTCALGGDYSTSQTGSWQAMVDSQG